jgi:hypothetical protein
VAFIGPSLFVNRELKIRKTRETFVSTEDAQAGDHATLPLPRSNFVAMGQHATSRDHQGN